MTNVKTLTFENRYSVPFEFGTSARDKPITTKVRCRSITVDIVRRGRARTVKREMKRFVRYAHSSLTLRDESVSCRVTVNSREEGILYEKHQAHNLIEHKKRWLFSEAAARDRNSGKFCVVSGERRGRPGYNEADLER